MQRGEFIEQVFMFFKSKDENLMRAYDLALTVKECIDWDKLYRIVLNEAESRYLPPPKWFKDFFPRCIKQDAVNYATQDGIKIRINLKDGYKYDYETYQNSLPFEEIKQRAMRRFKGEFANMQMFDETELQWVTN